MGKGILIWLIGAPIVFLLALQAACLLVTGQFNPLMLQDQYIQIRNIAFLLMLPGLGVLGWVAAEVIAKNLE